MKKSVCLISLPSPFLLDDHVFPPLGLLYVAAGLKEAGYKNVVVHDESIETIPAGYRIYGISCTTPQFEQAKQALERIKKTTPFAKVYIGGPQATVDPEFCLEAGFNGVVLNAGEAGLPLCISHDCALVDAPYKKILHPRRDLIDLKKYTYYVAGELATSIMTSRGCPYHCGFCCKVNKQVCLFPAEFVIDEIDLLHLVYGYNALMFFDDIFIFDKERALKIMRHLEKNLIRWRCFVRADVVLRHGLEFVTQMRGAGCVEVGIGIESGSDRILRRVNKGEDTATIRYAVAMLKQAGIRVKGFFIVGLPGESWETIAETRRFAAKLDLDDIDLTIYQPFKKSTIYNQKGQDIDWDEIDLQNSWYKGTPGKYVSQVRTPFLSGREIVEARDMLEKELKPLCI